MRLQLVGILIGGLLLTGACQPLASTPRATPTIPRTQVAAVTATTATASPTSAPATPMPYLPTPTAPPAGSVANLLQHRPPPGTTVEIDAYYNRSGIQPTGMVGEPGMILCQIRWAEVSLTDRPLPSLASFHGNSFPPGAAYLLATVPEALQPNTWLLPDLPFHARFRGHLDDPRQAQCDAADRIFVVEQVVTVYEATPPPDLVATQVSAAAYATWQRYGDAEGYSVAYPPDWRVDPLNDPRFLSAVALRSARWPNSPVIVRVWDHETPITGYVAPDPPPLKPIDGFSQYGQWNGFVGGPSTDKQLTGFQMDREIGATEREVIVIFNANGRTYELALRYPTGFDAQPPLLAIYSTIVESFRLDHPPTPTPTPP